MPMLSPSAIQAMHRAGRIAAQTLHFVGSKIAPGITTADIDRWVREDTKTRGAEPSQLGYKGYPHAVCTSRNHVVCHGMPSVNDVLHAGDIINVDVTSNIGGYHGDTSMTFAVGAISADSQRLIDTTRACLEAGISAVRHGAYLGDVGAAIHEIAKREGYSIVDVFGGHGIGRSMHEPPFVAHKARKGTGIRLKAGMAFTIEPMLNEGRASVRLLDDGWSVVTVDGKRSAQFEHTLIVTREGCEVTTQLSD